MHWQHAPHRDVRRFSLFSCLFFKDGMLLGIYFNLFETMTNSCFFLASLIPSLAALSHSLALHFEREKHDEAISGVGLPLPSPSLLLMRNCNKNNKFAARYNGCWQHRCLGLAAGRTRDVNGDRHIYGSFRSNRKICKLLRVAGGRLCASRGRGRPRCPKR